MGFRLFRRVSQMEPDHFGYLKSCVPRSLPVPPRRLAANPALFSLMSAIAGGASLADVIRLGEVFPFVPLRPGDDVDAEFVLEELGDS